MNSILTNNAALNALAQLRTISIGMEETQNHVSSGLRIAEASDNAAYWSIGSTMRADRESLSTINDALGLGASKVDTAYAGLNTVKDLLSQIRNKLTMAQESGADKDKINKEITQLKNQITTVSQSATFSGENWLYNNTATALSTKQMVGSFTRGADGSITIQMIDFDASKSTLIDRTPANGILTRGTWVSDGANSTAGYYLMTPPFAVGGTPAAAPNNTNVISINSLIPAQGNNAAVAATTTAQLGQMTAAIDAMMNAVIDVASTIGSVKARIDAQTSFVKNLMDTFDKGVSRLVDADMNEESTRLKAFQTQQQLAIQSLSIANGQAQNIMQLFRN